ncbi:restriction endonuclease subunit S [Akkermansia muciniphila]|uniref:restriction endonuclease subunit S n=1 Tax=Akkermansia muciniphila TaxID=239935 RepID=UPI0027D22452|nr:restriction endonuclease subunit S [Akkermansia muciniphila]MCI9266108.1 restriction endonuclease subunit S [Akkermansia muciniphila]WMB17307.1 restriction endonuclease subunit S [Akkermansia muciniphila]
MKYKWGDLITLEYGKPVKDKDSKSGNIPVFGTNGQIGTSHLPPLCPHASFILGRKGAYRGVHYSDVPFSVIDTAFYAKNIRTDILSLKWAYYKFLTYDINRMDSGSAIPSTDRYEIYGIEVELPPIKYQQKIVCLLEFLNKKIELNNRINDNLEQQARAIYQQMFIDNPDSSWELGILSDIANITMGQSPNSNSYNEEGNGTIFFQGRAEFGFRFPSVRLFTTEPKRMACENDTLMSVRAPVGDLNVAHKDCCIGRGLAAIHSKNNHQSFVHYTMFSLKKQLNVFNGEGTVFGSINRNALNEMPILIPSDEKLDKFESIVAPMNAAIRNNYDEICRLEQLRDTLLPKLMSGELDVSDIDL